MGVRRGLPAKSSGMPNAVWQVQYDGYDSGLKKMKEAKQAEYACEEGGCDQQP